MILYNSSLLSVFLVSFLFLITIYQCYQYFKDKSFKGSQLLFVVRLIAILLIATLFIHPVFILEKEYFNTTSLAVYTDNSKSMNNNLNIKEFNQISDNIMKWGIDNNCLINWYAVEDSVYRIDRLDIEFSKFNTDFDRFRKHVISNDYTHTLLITDGLNYLGDNQKYNFGKKINILGVGNNNNSNIVSFDAAFLINEEDKHVINFTINNKGLINDKMMIDIYKQDTFLDSKEIKLSNQKEYYSSQLDVSNLDLKDFNNLNLRLKDSIDGYDRFKSRINVFNNSKQLSEILLISGALSRNTKYIRNILNDMSDKVEHFYKINKQWNKSVPEAYDKFDMIVFENYPETNYDIDKFEKIVQYAKDIKLPIIIIIGVNQNYDILQKISSFLPFDVSNSSLLEEQLDVNNNYNYDISSFYPISSPLSFNFKTKNENNIYYKNGKSAIAYTDNDMFIFYPNIAGIAYKINNSKDAYFDKFIKELFNNGYYKNNRVELFLNRNEFYNNEEFEVKLFNISNINLKDAYLSIKDIDGEEKKYSLNNELEIKKKIFKKGSYSIQLFKNNQAVSNSVDIKIEDYLDESYLTGQNISFLNRISSESNGEYFNKENYLKEIANFQDTDSELIIYQDRVDSKKYLFILIISIIMLTFEWYFRKKNGLL